MPSTSPPWAFSSVVVAWFTFATGARAVSATRLNETRMGLVQWPTWPLRWVIVIGFAALLLVCLVNMIRSLRHRGVLGHRNTEELILAETASESGPTERT